MKSDDGRGVLSGLALLSFAAAVVLVPFAPLNSMAAAAVCYLCFKMLSPPD